MKKISLFLITGIVIFTSLLGCNEVDNVAETSENVFYASFETVEASDTKTYLSSNHILVWSKWDEMSIFMGNAANQTYRYNGEEGRVYGPIGEIPPYLTPGAEISTNYAVYPYNELTMIIPSSEILFLELPASQEYAENSFGLNANTMVAVTNGTNDEELFFKNLCGYLVVKLYGEEKIMNVSLKGNRDEKIAGSASVVAKYGKTPSVQMIEGRATEVITIDCGEGVTLGISEQNATEFWFCIPPLTFEDGFKVTISLANGETVVKNTNYSRTVQRNVYVTMPPLNVGMLSPDDPEIPDEIKIGDYLADYGGVVFACDENGGVYLVSLTEEHNKTWHDSKEWCEMYGDGKWYMPTIDELSSLQKQLSAVNQTLINIQGAVPICTDNICYWSSSENDGDWAWRMHMSDGAKYGKGSDEKKTSTKNYVRAIRYISGTK